MSSWCFKLGQNEHLLCTKKRQYGARNPHFYKEFEEAGEAFPLDFTVWAAITFGDVILVNGEQIPGPPSHSVVFHEMVHVVQYDD